MRKIKGTIILITVALTLLSCGCSKENDMKNDNTTKENITENTTINSLRYEQITGEEAKKIMDTEADYVIIDARTQEEFDEGHIENAILIPEYEIAERAEKELPDKNQLILVYCRSGRRSKIASQALVDLGYTNVKEFGGIIDWEYEIVK
jgi:rhodanese-related sulfurtransferase